MTFMSHFGRTFGTTKVLIVPGEEMPGREPQTIDALVQPEHISFDVDAPIYEGDELEWDDPRGGRRRVVVTEVKVYEAKGSMSSYMAHIEVLYASASTRARSRPTVGGHNIVVNGSNVTIAVGGDAVSQQVHVSGGYETLADTVGAALALLRDTKELDSDELEAAEGAAHGLLEEASKATPDRAAMKRLLPTLRGVLASAANAGAGAAASGLVSQLFI